jgi:hypothetical protein
MCVVDEENKPLFPDEEHIKLLAEKDITVLNKVAQACMAVNGFDQEKVVDSLKATPSE